MAATRAFLSHPPPPPFPFYGHRSSMQEFWGFHDRISPKHFPPRGRHVLWIWYVCYVLLNHLRGHAVGPISGLHAYAKVATKVVNACDNGQWPSPPSPSCQNSVTKWLNAWTYRVGLGLNGVARISAYLCENGSQQRLASLLCSGILQIFKKSASLSVQLGTKPT